VSFLSALSDAEKPNKASKNTPPTYLSALSGSNSVGLGLPEKSKIFTNSL